MALKYTCPHCGNEITLRFVTIGEEAKCRKCGNQSFVPEDAITIDNSEAEKRFISDTKTRKTDSDNKSENVMSTTLPVRIICFALMLFYALEFAYKLKFYDLLLPVYVFVTILTPLTILLFLIFFYIAEKSSKTIAILMQCIFGAYALRIIAIVVFNYQTQAVIDKFSIFLRLVFLGILFLFFSRIHKTNILLRISSILVAVLFLLRSYSNLKECYLLITIPSRWAESIFFQYTIYDILFPPCMIIFLFLYQRTKIHTKA